jgi:hypothetical protein
VNFTCYGLSVASKPISTLINFRAAGLCLCCDRLKRVLVNAWYSGGDGEMDGGDGKPSASFSMTTSDLLSTRSGTKFAIPSILTNDIVKHAACAAPSSSSGLVPGSRHNG